LNKDCFGVGENQELTANLPARWKKSYPNSGKALRRTSIHQPRDTTSMPLSEGIVNIPNLTFLTNRYFDRSNGWISETV